MAYFKVYQSFRILNEYRVEADSLAEALLSVLHDEVEANGVEWDTFEVDEDTGLPIDTVPDSDRQALQNAGVVSPDGFVRSIFQVERCDD
jgi:hypothetical protein